MNALKILSYALGSVCAVLAAALFAAVVFDRSDDDPRTVAFALVYSGWAVYCFVVASHL